MIALMMLVFGCDGRRGDPSKSLFTLKSCIETNNRLIFEVDGNLREVNTSLIIAIRILEEEVIKLRKDVDKLSKDK